MKVEIYLKQIDRAIGQTREAREQANLPVIACNAAFTARINTITDLSLSDPEIGSEDFITIYNHVANAIKIVGAYIKEV